MLILLDFFMFLLEKLFNHLLNFFIWLGSRDPFQAVLTEFEVGGELKEDVGHSTINYY